MKKAEDQVLGCRVCGCAGIANLNHGSRDGQLTSSLIEMRELSTPSAQARFIATNRLQGIMPIAPAVSLSEEINSKNKQSAFARFNPKKFTNATSESQVSRRGL